MSVFDNYNDLSNQIVREGQEISVKFVRNGDGTGTVSWNIPPPANGCSAANQAYDGIVITGAPQAPNYVSDSPKNGTFYNGDPTLNFSASLGDKIGEDNTVLGAFYHDKTTTSLTVTDVDPTTWYYISAYAVDGVGNYHREGMHAYSLPTGASEGTETEYPAYQDIVIVPKDGTTVVYGNTPTGLNKAQSYSFKLKIDGTEYTININGVDAQTYTDLVNAINLQLKLLGTDYYSSPVPPNTGKYYLDMTHMALYQWNGTNNVAQPLIIFNQDPSTHPQGAYWYNPVSDIIYMYETGGWSPQPLIKLDHAPNEPVCGELWFTGTSVYEWDGDHWIKLCLYVQSTNPQLAPVLNCNTYWFDETNSILNKWDTDTQSWDEVMAIISQKDPNTLGVGDFWLNETDGLLYRFSAGTWNQVLETRYDTTTPTDPAPNIYWYNPTTQLLVKRDPTNTVWIPYEYTLYPTDPTVRVSNDLWWNQNSSIDHLYVWDIVNNQWLPVGNFYQQVADPSLPPNLPPCAVWYNPSDGTLKYILKNSCTDRDFISSTFDPTHPIPGTIWLNTVTHVWSVWNGAGWTPITPIVDSFDPFALQNGYFWFDPATSTLKMWNGTAWVATSYSTTPLNPKIGDQWLNTTTNHLYQWSGSGWVDADPLAFVSLRYIKSQDQNFNGRPYLRFQTTLTGCCHLIFVEPDSTGLFTQIMQSVMYNDPVPGNNGVGIGAMYNRLGVGTDGSPDERRVIHDYVRQSLGYPTLQVELMKSQIDTAIDTALLTLRKYAGYGYNRQFFFMDLKPNQQIYMLTDKCVGFNKIVEVKDITRMRAGWITTAFAGNDLFGLAALQQLYTVGSFDMLSFHLMSSYTKEMEQLFATRVMFQFHEKSRQLRLYQHCMSNERVLVDAMIERTEQDLMTDRETSLWIKKWALAESKMMLGEIRSKYLNLAGPNGSTSLNGSDLKQAGKDEKDQLMEQLNDPSMQNYTDIGIAADIVIG